MNKILLSIGVILVFASFCPAQDNIDSVNVDRFEQVLNAAGLSRSDLGYQPKGYWNRFPNPKLIPHILPFFEDLFAEPMKTYDFTKTMGNAVEYYLNPEFFDTSRISLHRIVYLLGVDRKITGFRNISVNLDPDPDTVSPMLDAFKRIESSESKQSNYITFGNQYGGPGIYDNLIEKTEQLPIKLQKIVASLMLNLYDAYKWRKMAVRNLDYREMTSLFTTKNLTENIRDGSVYYPQIDDIADKLDEHSLYYACMKTVQAAEDCYKDLKEYLQTSDDDLSDILFEFDCVYGKIVILGTGNNKTSYRDAAILIDLGGNDEHSGNTGATPDINTPVCVAIDMSGKDTYNNDDPDILSQGSAILGAGVLIDGEGNDKYISKKMSQGCGLFGLGLLLDVKGDDDYQLETSGQGCGRFGLGFALDISGDDSRYIYGEGQGFGGVGGIGVIADYQGNDKYSAEPYADVVDRGDYHSEHKINANAAQGAGMGRRADGSDGHSWAGGLGALIDIKGNDEYFSGNWTLGCGFWYGTGLVYEGEGDDLYKSVYFTQASGAHFCIGAIVDEGGNDTHQLWENAGAGIAFGWDYTNALLFDIGGDDKYIAKIISIGCAEIRSNAILIDVGGDDYYQLQKDQLGFGASDYQKDYDKPNRFSPYRAYSKSIGILLDIGGNDEYFDWVKKYNKTIKSEKCSNNSLWFTPAEGDKNYGAGNYGIGMDVETGRVPEFEFFVR